MILITNLRNNLSKFSLNLVISYLVHHSSSTFITFKISYLVNCYFSISFIQSLYFKFGQSFELKFDQIFYLKFSQFFWIRFSQYFCVKLNHL